MRMDSILIWFNLNIQMNILLLGLRPDLTGTTNSICNDCFEIVFFTSNQMI